MDFGALIPWLSSLSPVLPIIFTVIGILVVAAQAVVAVTPSQADDAVLAKVWEIPVLGPVLKALAALAPFKK